MQPDLWKAQKLGGTHHPDAVTGGPLAWLLHSPCRPVDLHCKFKMARLQVPRLHSLQLDEASQEMSHSVFQSFPSSFRTISIQMLVSELWLVQLRFQLLVQSESHYTKWLQDQDPPLSGKQTVKESLLSEFLEFVHQTNVLKFVPQQAVTPQEIPVPPCASE